MLLEAFVCLSVFLSVCVLATLLKTLFMDWAEILWRGLAW